ARVEIDRRVFGRRDPYRGRQAGVDGAQQCAGCDIALKRKSGDLPERVNAGVGAASTDNRHLASIELAERVFEETLNRSARGLALPTDEVSPVVRERDLECRQAESPQRTRWLQKRDSASRVHWAGSRFHHRQPLRAKRALVGLVGRQV